MRSMLPVTLLLKIEGVDGIKTRTKTQVAFQILNKEPINKQNTTIYIDLNIFICTNHSL